MPRYPSFNNDVVNYTIADSQRVYGQHFFCFKVEGKIMSEILLKTSMARLYVYKSTFSVPKPLKPEGRYFFI